MSSRGEQRARSSSTWGKENGRGIKPKFGVATPEQLALPMTDPVAYMLDTNVFNAAADGQIPVETFVGRKMLATNVQVAEVSATRSDERRARLLDTFTKLDPASVPASSMVWGLAGAGWDQANWNDRSGAFEKMLVRLKELDAQAKKKPSDPRNQLGDIVIAETALKLGATLVTDDANLRQTLIESGGRAISRAAFLL
jgi:hypothetical protein